MEIINSITLAEAFEMAEAQYVAAAAMSGGLLTRDPWIPNRAAEIFARGQLPKKGDSMDELLKKAAIQSAAERKLLLLLASTIADQLIGSAQEWEDSKRKLAVDIIEAVEDVEEAAKN